MSNNKGQLSHADHHIKALGLQIVIQLPRDKEKALAIIEHARWLVTNYLHSGEEEECAEPTKRELKIVS
jgi:hypothetical protein